MSGMPRPSSSPPRPRPTPVSAIVALTALASLSTGLFWNGMPFIAENDYGFSEKDNFALFALLGFVYVAVALAAGRILRAAERIMSARSVMVTILLVQGVACLLPWWIDHSSVIWVVTGVVSVSSAILWPTVESYLSAGRSGRRLRFTMGIWNVTWTLSVGIALLAMAPFMKEDVRVARYAVVALSVVNVLSVVTLRWFNPRPLEPGDDTSGSEVGPNYRYLLHAARVLLPVSYILMGMIGPLMPYRMESLHIESTLKTPFTATWMFARVAAIAVMWLTPFWHGRWGTLLLGGISVTGGFLMLLAAPNVPTLFAGLALFGGGQGIIYYAAIYYVMSVGHAQVDAAGTHEGLIGLGYAAGPCVGLLTLWIAEAAFAGDAEALAITRIGFILLVMIGAAILVVRPYLAARRFASSHPSGSRYMSR